MNVLITGTNGMIAQKTLLALREYPTLRVIASSRGPNRLGDTANYLYAAADLTSTAALNGLIEKYRPDTLIHCAAMAGPDLCQMNPDQCRRINTDAVRDLVHACLPYKTHLIYLSTDFVFDGRKASPYREEDSPSPLSVYGASKRAAEEIVRQYPLPWAMVRTILVYGTAPYLTRPNIVLRVKKSLEQGQRIRVVNDQFRTPTFVEDLVCAIIEIVLRRSEGIYHVSGKDRVSIYELAVMAAKIFGLDAGLIEPAATAQLNEPAQRPHETVFALERARRDLDYAPHSLADGLRRLKQQLDNTPPCSC